MSGRCGDMEQAADQIYDWQFAREVAEFLVEMDRQTPSIPTVMMPQWVMWVKWAKLFLENRNGK